MLTLAQTTEGTKKILKWSGIIIGGIIVLRLIIIPLTIFTFTMIFPPKPDLPSVTFGKLPKMEFPQQQTNQLAYSVQTQSGTFPPTCQRKPCPDGYFPDRIPVFKTIVLKPTLYSFNEGKKKVANIGFTDEPTTNDNIIYQWNNAQNVSKIIFNTVTHEFDFTTPLASSSADITSTPPTQNDAIGIAKGFLSNLNITNSVDFDDQKTKVTYLTLDNSSLLPATSISQASYVQVDFLRKGFETYPFINPDPNRTLISLLLKGGQDRQPIVEAHFTYHLIDTENPTLPATYPLKQATDAFTDLQKGNAYIIRKTTISPIAIRNVYLAYYESRGDLSYILPVFVFEGDNNFLAIVPAITDLWFE